MSILIKNMKMPKKGLVEIIISPDGKAYVLARPLIDTEHAEVSETYDASELPDHGDLIDRDVLLSKVQKWYWEALETVKRMPTVIPAERREDGET